MRVIDYGLFFKKYLNFLIKTFKIFMERIQTFENNDVFVEIC